LSSSVSQHRCWYSTNSSVKEEPFAVDAGSEQQQHQQQEQQQHHQAFADDEKTPNQQTQDESQLEAHQQQEQQHQVSEEKQLEREEVQRLHTQEIIVEEQRQDEQQPQPHQEPQQEEQDQVKQQQQQESLGESNNNNNKLQEERFDTEDRQQDREQQQRTEDQQKQQQQRNSSSSSSSSSLRTGIELLGIFAAIALVYDARFRYRRSKLIRTELDSPVPRLLNSNSSTSYEPSAVSSTTSSSSSDGSMNEDDSAVDLQNELRTMLSNALSLIDSNNSSNTSGGRLVFTDEATFLDLVKSTTSTIGTSNTSEVKRMKGIVLDLSERETAAEIVGELMEKLDPILYKRESFYRSVYGYRRSSASTTVSTALSWIFGIIYSNTPFLVQPTY